MAAAAEAAGAGRTRFASFLPLGLVSIWQSAQASWYESNTTRVVGVRGDTPRGALRWPGRCPRCAPWPVGLSFYHPLGEESKDQGCSKASVRRYSLCCDAPGTEPPRPTPERAVEAQLRAMDEHVRARSRRDEAEPTSIVVAHVMNVLTYMADTCVRQHEGSTRVAETQGSRVT